MIYPLKNDIEIKLPMKPEYIFFRFIKIVVLRCQIFNCLNLPVKYEFNILTRVIAITLFINYIIISYGKGVQALF